MQHRLLLSIVKVILRGAIALLLAGSFMAGEQPVNMTHSNQSAETTAIALHLIAELKDGYGKLLAFSQDSRTWVAADWGMVHIWHDLMLHYSLPKPAGEAISQVFWEPHANCVFASPHRLDVASRQWLSLPSVSDRLLDGLEETPAGSFTVQTSAWSPDGADMVVFADYRPSRRSRTPDRWQGPTGRLLWLEGATRQLIQVLWEGRGETISAIAIGDRAIVAAGETMRVWDRHTRQIRATHRVHRGMVRQMQFSPNGRLLASIGADGQLILWDTAQWTQIASWQAHDNDGWAIAFHPTLPILASGGWDNQVKLWSLDGQLLTIATLTNPVEGVGFSQGGDRLVVAQRGTDAKLVVYEVRSPS